jgi:hypothetical protein
MPYLSQTARKNLRKYAYKAVDEYVYPTPHRPLILTIPQVLCIPIRPSPLLELVHHSLAADGCAEHSTL